MKKRFNFKLLAGILLLTSTLLSFAQTPVQSWGQLHVEGTDIVNESGNAIQLQGMSLFWSQWEPDFYEYNTIKWLRDDWCNNIVRAACGVEDNGSPFYGMEFQLEKARTVIDAAIDLNMYVLVDWHAHYATYNTAAAKTFFSTIAQEYGNYPNIIYETFNEPIGYSWNDLKPYHEDIINEIRKYDANNIIVCGTPEYSACPDAVIGNAINKSNIAYTLHYYAGSHFQDYRNRANAARGNGLCVFVTEYGLVNADGNGNVNEGSANNWWNWMNENNISHCNWSMCDKNEGSAALTPGTSAGGFWNDNQLTWSGGLVRGHLKASCPDYPTKVITYANIPSKIEAENYSKMSGIQKEPTEDIGEGANIGYTDPGDFLEYNVKAAGDGMYSFRYRIAANSAAEVRVLIDGVEEHIISINTGGWQTWEDVTKNVSLTTGNHIIRLEAITAGWNLNYIDITSEGLVDCNGDLDGNALIDDCDICSGGNTGIAVNACQNGCLSGYSPYGVKDDFTLETDPYNENGALYSWGEEDLAGDNNPGFQALVERNQTNETLDIMVTQAEGDYVPFGFSFGETNSIDISNDATYEFIFTNPSSVDVNIALAIQDKDGNIINTSSAADGEPFADAWQYGITANVKAGATFTFKGDFAGGFNGNYATETYDSEFDYTRVETVLLTVTNQENTGTPNYLPLDLKDVEIQIEELRIGDCSGAYYDNGKDCNGDLNGTATIDKCDVCSGGKTGVTPDDCVLGVNDQMDKASLTLFPNPASETIQFSKAINWTLSNLLGETIATGSGKTVDIQELTNGMYIITTESEAIKFIKK